MPQRFPDNNQEGVYMERKKFKELEFKDAFMFAAVMEDAEICRRVLMCILGFPIREVRVHTESAILVNPDYRGIRLDVYADDEAGSVYDVEMQTTDKGNLPKRSRCYQGQMDVAFLEPGEDFGRLPKSFVIFICTFDLFGRKRYIYTFEERCLEDGEPLGDETRKVFLSTKGENRDEVSEELIQFLRFVEQSEVPLDCAQDALTKQLSDRIAKLKRDRRMEARYMLLGELLDDERREAREEGRKEGQSQLLTLIKAMTADGNTKELARLEEDPAYLEEMFEKYHIS